MYSRQRAPRVRPADQRAGAVRGLGGGRKQLEGGGARGAVRHRQRKRQQVSERREIVAARAGVMIPTLDPDRVIFQPFADSISYFYSNKKWDRNTSS